MRIAIQSADLDAQRIDGTRVYMWQLLNRFGDLAPEDIFFLYHRKCFNPAIEPKRFPNYRILMIPFPFFWTQTRFALALRRSKPDRLWMPMQAIPLLREKRMQTTVTIHDLAFRKFPKYFPSKDLRRLEFFTDQAIRKSDRIIAVSENTKRDILVYYPGISEKKIRVIYHGYEFQKTRDILFSDHIEDSNEHSRVDGRYILYLGAIQPRKNLETLIRAFEKIKKDSRLEDVKLVLAGERAWLWEGIEKVAQRSLFRKDIIIMGAVSFLKREALYGNARIFVFPSLYEGFGIPVLEAFSHRVPVVCANNSSLPEVGGGGAMYFETNNTDDLAEKMRRMIEDETLRAKHIKEGIRHLQKFSWDRCAKETLEWIRGDFLGENFLS